MDAMRASTHHRPMRVLPHIKRLDDCFGDFLVRVVCECGACREIQPQAVARLVGWKMKLKELALQYGCDARSAEESCRGRGGCETQTARSAEEPALTQSLLAIGIMVTLQPQPAR